MEITNYKLIEKIVQTNWTLLYRAKQLQLDVNAIIKVLNDEHPTIKAINALKNEYQLFRQFKEPGFMKVFELLEQNGTPFLIMENFTGKSLRNYISNKSLALKEFFPIALQMVSIVGALHHANIIHKDIRPENFVIDPNTLNIKLIDLSLAIQLPRENQDYTNPNELNGSVIYMSPEQTGRMNRSIDYRADFYSLGVTFFEMLTGQLPFQSADTLELIHEHLAKLPPKVSDLNPDVPLMLSAIIDKLLSKTPEDRYASAAGLKNDLENCANQWFDHHFIDQFTLGRKDVHDHLHISHRLYGRENEINILMNAFDDVTRGSAECIMVTGYAGVGKTSLVKELYKPITRQKGYFISGKFDQLERSTPYSAIIKAFQGLIRQILAEPEEQLLITKTKMLTALGHIGQVIINVIPEVEIIIGTQPAIEELNPTEAQNRFNMLFQRFVSIFAQPEHPLIIFLDDLQWADTGSLKFLELLLTDPAIRNILVIGAYRDNEVGQDHLLKVITLPALQKADVKVEIVTLKPLDIQSIEQLLIDTFFISTQKSEEFAQLLLAKTNGNPFFINEFIKSLYQEKLINFVYETSSWDWDIAKIKQQQITDNVVDLMIQKIERLSSDTKQVLQIAACIGHQFDLKTLSVICGVPPKNVYQALWSAIVSELIYPISQVYKPFNPDSSSTAEDNIETDHDIMTYEFNHDRIQQAVYQLIPHDEKPKLHLKIARLLVKNKPLTATDRRLFNIVNHYNAAYSNITSQEERSQVATYNLWAGMKAKVSAAYEIALNYFLAGIGFISENDWDRNYSLVFNLYKNLPECFFLTGDLEEAEKYLSILFKKAATRLDAAEIYMIRMQIYASIGQHSQVIKTGLEALRLFKLNFSPNPSKLHILYEMFKVHRKIGFFKLKNILQTLPKMKNPDVLMMNNIIDIMHSSAYFYNQNLMAVLTARSLYLHLKYGYSTYFSSICIVYGSILVIFFSLPRIGFNIVDLGLAFEKKFSTPSIVCRNHTRVGLILNPWRNHMITNVDFLQTGYQAGMESGDVEYMVYSLNAIMVNHFYAGIPLKTIEKEVANAYKFVKRVNNTGYFYLLKLWRRGVHSLIGKENFSASYFDKYLNLIDSSDFKSLQEVCYGLCSFVAFTLGEYKSALNWARHNYRVKEYARGTAQQPFNLLIYCLCFTNIYYGNRKKQRKYLKLLKSSLKEMTWSAKLAPQNFLFHKLAISAEIARIRGDNMRAGDCYAEAIAVAKKNNYIQFVALINEQAARFYLEIDKPYLAKYFLIEAYYHYYQWHATEKCNLLEKQYPQWLHETTTLHEKLPVESSIQQFSVDLLAIIKANQTISNEIKLDEILQKLIKVVIEIAGAQRVVLLHHVDNEWSIEAEGNKENLQIHLTEHVNTLLRPDLPLTLINYVQRTQEALIINNAVEDEKALHDPYVVENHPLSMLVMPMFYQGELKRILYLENNVSTYAFNANHLQSLNLLASQAAISLENAKYYTACDRFVPYAFLNRLNKHSIIDVHSGEHTKRVMSILFCDIQGYTTLSESKTAANVFKLICDLLGGIEPIIRSHHGFIDKYIGDAVMALFDKADDAVAAGKDIAKFVADFNSKYCIENNIDLKIGIGINTGTVILGLVGNNERMDCTVIGDAVNTASRIEHLTRDYGSPLLISGSTKNKLSHPEAYDLKLIENVNIRGKAQKMDLWSVNIETTFEPQKTKHLK